jgi:putative transposase
MLQWGAEHTIDLHFIDPGKPTQNAHVQSFNGRARDEFLNLHSFLTLDQARAVAAAWLVDYNEVRPRSSLGNLMPVEFVKTIGPNQPSAVIRVLKNRLSSS